MARVWLAFCLLFFLFTNTPCLDVSQILVPTNDGISGVLLVQSKTYEYSFNATTAKEACKTIQMRIAKLAEVETANQNGLQTCRFGWIEEQVAVISRIEKHEKCGKNSLGVSVWKAHISKKFDVYCFKPAGPDGSFETTSSSPQPTTAGRTPSNKHYSTKTTHPSSIKSTSSPPYTSTSSISFVFNTSSVPFITRSLSNISDSSQSTTSTPFLSSSSSRTLPRFSISSPSSSSHSSTRFLFQHTSRGQPALSHPTTPNRVSRHTLTSTDQPALSQTTTLNRPSQHTLTSTGQPALSQTTTPNRASQHTLTSTGQSALSQTTTPNRASQHTLTSTGQSALSQTTTLNRASQHTLTSTGQSALSQTTTLNRTSQHTLTSTGQPALSQTTTPNRASQPALFQSTTPSRATPKTFVIISFVLLLLLAAAGAAWYLKIKRRHRFPSWIKMRPTQMNETEMWKKIKERHCMPEQISKDNNCRECNSIIFQMEQELQMEDSP